MPTTRFNVNLAAGAANRQVLQGSLFEVIEQAGTLVIAAVADTAAGNLFLAEVLIGSETVMEESPVPLEPAAGQGPNLQDHILIREPVTPGDKVTLRVRNADVAARNARFLVSVP
jgi:hypothetical protein